MAQVRPGGSVPRERSKSRLEATFAILTAVAALVAGGSIYVSPWLAVGLIVAALLAMLAVLVHRDHYLTGAIVLFAVVPVSYVPIPFPSQFLAPSNLLVIAYAVAGRRFRVPWLPRSYFWLVLLLAVYLAAITALGGSQSVERKVAWLLALVGVVLVPPGFASSKSVFDRVVRGLALTGSLLGLVAVVEHYTQRSPYSGIFIAGPYPLLQVWEVYRVTTTLGHPLLNSTFFSMAAAVGWGLLLIHRRWCGLPVGAICTVAVVLTASRSGILALGAGVSVLFLVSAWRAPVRWAVKFGLLGVLLAFSWTVLLGNPLVERLTGAEARSSGSLREDYPMLVRPLLEVSDFLGTGPGTSDLALMRVGGLFAGTPLESSALQIVASMGVVGSVLLLLGLGTLLFSSARRGAVVGPAVVATYCVSASGYNLLEAYPAALALPALALILTVSEVAEAAAGNITAAPRVTGGGLPAPARCNVAASPAAVSS